MYYIIFHATLYIPVLLLLNKLSFIHSFIELAIYCLRAGILKRVNRDAMRAVCRLNKDISEALYAIPSDKSRSFAKKITL